MERPVLLSVPNVSEGRDPQVVEAIAKAFAGARAGPGEEPPVRLLDVHSDPHHHRSVYTLASRAGTLAEALLRGGAVAVDSVDVLARSADGGERPGEHPHVGALDVVPIVYLDERRRGAACAEALVVADRLGEELALPVFLYGELSGSPPLTRAELRRGGIEGLRRRIAEDGLRPDFGPPRLHPTAGAVLVAARPPLVAFNLRLAPPAGATDARRIASLIREGGAEGLPGVRAIGVELSGEGQVSVNVERPLETPLAAVVGAVARHARIAAAELVGLAPASAFDSFPPELPIPGFDPGRHLIENALGSL